MILGIGQGPSSFDDIVYWAPAGATKAPFAVSSVLAASAGINVYFLNARMTSAGSGVSMGASSNSFHASFHPIDLGVELFTEAELDAAVEFVSKTELAGGTLIYVTTTGTRTFEKVAVDSAGNDLFAESTE